MPYDPAFPPTGAELISAEFRAQFAGLKELIDAIPEGPPGPPGADGSGGADGAPGPQGPQGEISQGQLDAAVAAVQAGSSANSNGVALLGIGVSDPPTQGEMQAIANKLDELIQALRRT